MVSVCVYVCVHMYVCICTYVCTLGCWSDRPCCMLSTSFLRCGNMAHPTSILHTYIHTYIHKLRYIQWTNAVHLVHTLPNLLYDLNTSVTSLPWLLTLTYSLLYACMYVCMYACMHIVWCTNAWMYVCMYTSSPKRNRVQTQAYICMCAYVLSLY